MAERVSTAPEIKEKRNAPGRWFITITGRDKGGEKCSSNKSIPALQKKAKQI